MVVGFLVEGSLDEEIEPLNSAWKGDSLSDMSIDEFWEVFNEATDFPDGQYATIKATKDEIVYIRFNSTFPLEWVHDVSVTNNFYTAENRIIKFNVTHSS